MNKQNITKWVKALRSGEYKQTRGMLQNNKGFCCLGVACKIFISEKNQTLNDNDLLYGGLVDQLNATQWLKNINGNFNNKTQKTFIKLNDIDKLTFDEIADLLEAVYIHKVL